MRYLPLLALLGPMALGGCVLDEELKPVETILDQQSAITVQAMGAPYILANEKASLAANARDYLDLRLLETDQMGRRVYLLSIVAFSTVDRRGQPNALPAGLAHLEVHAGAKTYELTAVEAGTDAYGLSGRLFPRRNGFVGSAEYLVTADFIRDLAAAPESGVSIDVGAGDNARYSVWEAANEGLKTFADRLPRGPR